MRPPTAPPAIEIDFPDLSRWEKGNVGIPYVWRFESARPGPKLTVNFRGTERLEDNIRRAGRRLSLALTAGGALVASAITASSTHVAAWIPAVLGAAGGALALGLVADLVRRGR